MLLLAASLIRLYRLDAFPPGLTHDEAGHGHDAVAILHGARPIYQTVGYGREPLYDYVTAALMVFTGPTPLALRLVSVAAGLLTLALTFAWARRAFDAPTALIAVALQAASFWSLTVSRQGLRSTLLPTLFTAAVYFFWRAMSPPFSSLPLRGGDRGGAAISLVSLLIGATLYTYLAARVTWIVFIFFLVYLWLWHRTAFRRVWFSALLAILIGLLLSAPMFLWLQQHPGAEQRLAMLDAPMQALRHGDVSVLLERAWSGLSAFFIAGHGDDFLAYGPPGRPLLDPVTGFLAAGGMWICIARWRKPAYAFALIWFAVGVGPTLITGASASITRSIAALPVTFVFPALAAAEGVRWLSQRGLGQARRLTYVLLALVVAIGVISARDYYAWAESPDVRAAYQHTTIEIARYLDKQPSGSTVALSTVYPQAPHDPYVIEISLRRRDLDLRWYDGRAALVLPPGPARLIVPASTPLAAAFTNIPGLRLIERITLRPDDLDPYFDVYDWQPQATLAGLRGDSQAHTANLGNVIQLIGYRVSPARDAPNNTIEVLTLWRVLDPGPVRAGGLVLFTHALNSAGQIVEQEDRLDAPAWAWQPGDVIAQVHRISLPAEAGKELTLEIGAYRPNNMTRLPILVNGAAVDNRLLLESVQPQ